VYRFAPNLEDAKWKWSTPGSLCAVVLWVTSTLALRFYVAHITNYERIYGHLNTVVMLMLWLYFTNAAILIGGEMNSEIEKAAGKRNCSNRAES
jgi:membrane protein